MRVVFWGTPEFATPALRALIGEGFDVAAVVTQPDRPTGRHHSAATPSPVKQVAVSEGIPVLQPASARDESFQEELHRVHPDISVVVAYGQILPRRIIDLPRLGTLNIHASLLPAYRGAAPIQAAIRDGVEETGVSIMQMEERLDSGPVLLQMRTPVLPDETAGELQLRLSEMGALALVEALLLISLDRSTQTPQDDAAATFAPKIAREMALIEWGADAASVARAIRAYDPKPGAFTTLHDQEVRLFGARAVESRAGDPGAVLEVDESGLLVGAGQGAVRVAYVHPAGKRRMAALDWHQGRGVAVGDTFGVRAP